MGPGDNDPKSPTVQGEKGAKVQSSTGKDTGVQGQVQFARAYQLGNRIRERSPVDGQRTTRMARPERGHGDETVLERPPQKAPLLPSMRAP